jgi:hypothetical protein
MDGSAFSGMGEVIATMMIACVIFVPLGIWKCVDIIIWLWHHFHIVIT